MPCILSKRESKYFITDLFWIKMYMTIVTIHKYFIFKQGESIIQTILGEPKLQTFWPSLYSITTFKSLNFSLFWKNIKSSLIEDAFGKKKVFTIAKKNLVPMDGNHLKSPEHFWQKCNKKSWLFRQVSFRKLVILCGDGPSREKKMIGKPNHLLQHYFWCHTTSSSSRPQAKKVVVRC